jgi:lipopolysaccharide transport system ATP-binding protein
MSEFAGTGRTVLFVSHSMPTIFRLCPRVILLDRGGVVADGPSATVVAEYLSSGLGSSAQRVWDDPAEAPGDDLVRLRAVRVLNAEGEVVEEIDSRRRFAVEVEYDLLREPDKVRPFANLHFFNDEGVCLFVSGDHVNEEWSATARRPGAVRSTCWVPGDFLNEGRVIVTAAVSSLDPTVVHARENDAVAFMVVDKSEGGARAGFARDLPGAVRPLFEWSVSSDSAVAASADACS